ncbi:MAG TPA: hypothetical protein VL947_08170 [Cytophagales bacterium]|nr:hypothetical protein [Cytophagales bacterium]
MYVPFDHIDLQSRIWVFQAPKSFSPAEVEIIERQLKLFCEDWTSHNHLLESSFIIAKQQFIILAINEAVHEASGCSIDKSIHVIKDLSQRLQVDLLDKGLVSFVHQDTVRTIKLAEIKAEINSGHLTASTPVFNTIVASKKEFLEHFETPAANTWLKRYFVQSLI